LQLLKSVITARKKHWSRSMAAWIGNFGSIFWAVTGVGGTRYAAARRAEAQRQGRSLGPTSKRGRYDVTHMSKFLVLYRSEGALTGPSVSEMFSKSTPEQLAAGMDAWRAWHEKCGGAIVDLGAPLDKSVTVAGPGKATPGKTTITGYTFLQAGSLDEAVTLMEGHPHFHMPGASVQILEYISMPG
jgi:hypothetical protein